MYQQPEIALVDPPLTQLYQKHANTILTYIDRHVSSKEDAEDLLLEVFIGALESQNWVMLSDKEQLAWLHRVAHNKLVDYYRRVKRRPSIHLDETIDALFEEDEQGPEYIALRHEDYAFVQQCVSLLPNLQQEILRLRFGHGLHAREIGQILNKSDLAVRTLLSRTLKALRSAYIQQHGDVYHE